MLHDNMNISCLIVHDQQAKELRSKRKSRDAQRVRSFDGGASRGRLDIQDKPRFKKRSSNQVHTKSPKPMMIGFQTLSLKREEVLVHTRRNQLVESVARSTMVIALLGRTKFFVSGKSGHKVRYFRNVKCQDKG